MSRKKISDLTIKRLYALSGNRCAFPGCTIEFFNGDKMNLSNICHIEDANPDSKKKNRFNEKMTDEQRADFSNLILLCPNHHKETEDPIKYKVEDLKMMKKKHEKKIQELTKNKIINSPSLLGKIIILLNKNKELNDGNEEILNPPKTNEKIKFNNLIENRPIIENYKVFQGKLNLVFKEIENDGSNKKEIILIDINTLYKKEILNYKNIEEIRNNADLIFNNIREKLLEKLETKNNETEIEVLEYGLNIIIVDAFMRCKIFEEPKI